MSEFEEQLHSLKVLFQAQIFQTRAQTPADVLRHIGSPFAPDKDTTQRRVHAA